MIKKFNYNYYEPNYKFDLKLLIIELIIYYVSI